MTIKEMEEQIDVLNLDKLEVKMKKGRQVHFMKNLTASIMAIS